MPSPSSSSPASTWRARALEGAIALALGALLALVWTWPLGAELASRVPHDPRFAPAQGSDTHLYLWNLWWGRAALASGADPFWCPLIYAPRGHSLALHTHAFLWGALSAPLQASCGLACAFNLTLLALFASAAAAAYALGRELCLERRAAALLGFAWAFSPYFLQKGLEHLSFGASPWPPLFALCLLRAMRAQRSLARWRASAAAGLVLGASLWCDPIPSAYLALFGAGVFAFAPAGAQGAAPRRRAFALGCGPWLLALSAALVAWPWLRAAARELASLAELPPEQGNLARAQLEHPRATDFLRPSALQAWSGAAAARTAVGENSALYLGYALLALAGCGAAISRAARSWLALAALLLLVCWDPGPQPEGWISGIYRRWPGFDALRAPARLFPLAHLALCCAAASGFAALTRSSARHGLRALGWALALCVPLEFWSGTYPSMPFPAPTAVRAIAAEPGSGAVLSLPFSGGAHASMAWQAQHGRPVPWSYVARAHPDALAEIARRAPALYALASGGTEPAPEVLAAELEALGIEHVLASPAELAEPARWSALLDALPGWERVPLPSDAAGLEPRWWRRVRAASAR
jgi:hypothetical protein